MRRLALVVTGLVAATSLLTGPLSGPTTAAPGATGVRDAAPAAVPPAARVPSLQVTRVMGGLDVPWDVAQLPGGRIFVTERNRKRLLTHYRGVTKVVAFPASTVWAGGETGLMGLEIDPGFSRNLLIYTCQGGYRSGGGHDVRVVAWRMAPDASRVTFVKTLRAGIPSASNGRHGGCRLFIDKAGAMIVGTGDAATGTHPQDRGSFAGKVLRFNRSTGAPWPTNPYAGSPSQIARFVLTYGHRNVQGISLRSDGSLWTAEHGPDRDDEVNRLVGGGNYGWNPVPGYDESVPMTDTSLPNAQTARWDSGFPTVATSGIHWLYGSQWGDLNGTLAVAALKGQRLMFQRADTAGNLSTVLNAVTSYGRLRSVSPAANGDLLVTTSNGGGRDQVLRVHPVL